MSGNSLAMNYVYLFGEEIWDTRNPKRHAMKQHNRIKIGSTRNPVARLAQLRTLNPEWDFRMVWFDPGCGLTLERALQRHYRSVRIAGELFDIPTFEVLWLTDRSASFFAQHCELLDSDWMHKWQAAGSYRHAAPEEEWEIRRSDPNDKHEGQA